jgi:phosphoribosylglycinamide formyltransferase-1
MKTIILGSGKGSNCQAILDSYSAGLLNSSKIVAVVSDQESSGILEVANASSIPATYLGNYERNNPSIDRKWIKELKKSNPDLIVLAGFMSVLSNDFIEAFHSRIINLHPSLLPSFPGLNAIRKAWVKGVKITGCTVHWVSPEIDSGKIIAQAPVRIMPSDTLDSVTAKVHAAEHMLLPSVIAQLSQEFVSSV